ncbi:DUF3871 family protein [Fibrella forsythiae]|uniref:DUF3871 family protein n=1 Tax=Fibrella forsythiae TaxID=2817061 RepID=A0ABS3JRL8_9BACT|nr:DUF3871 family protein [Fibrella forsythiae]MBO0952021.1 DUF3871 family protein [Fibrella forsythiae]
METQLIYHESNPLETIVLSENRSSETAFITANTIAASLPDIQQHHIIPVYSRDNEPLISHGDFIETALSTVNRLFPHETVLNPTIRVSHPVKGRIPQARNKPAKELADWEKTLYYERAAFVIEIPTIYDTVGSNLLSLTVGGVKSYSLDSLHQKKGADEHFKVFIGFQNKVCTNLCVWSDGYIADLRVKSLDQLTSALVDLISRYRAEQQIQALAQLTDYYLTETQFAQLIGRCRLYQFLPPADKRAIPPLLLGDQQFSTIARDYYRDESFCRQEDGLISLWNVYNLFTGAVKTSYIDTFLDRNVNSFDLATRLLDTVRGGTSSWYLQ